MASALILLQVGSTILQVGGGLASADAARKKGAVEQKIYNERAKDSIVTGQQKMLRERHMGDLVASRALALAAASGTDAADPSNLAILADIKGESAYRESVAVYQGEEEARILRMGGEAARREGEAKGTAYTIGAIGAGLSGAASIYTKYGAGRPPPVEVSEPVYSFERGY